MKKVILTVIAAAVAGPVFAANAYVGGSVGRAEQKLNVEGTSISASDTGAKLVGGYQVTPLVGVEAGYAFLGEAKASTDGYSASVKPKALYVAVTGTMPLTPAVSAFVKIGAAHTKTTLSLSYAGEFESEKETETSVLAGIGASFALSPQVSVVAEYEHFGKIVKGDGGSLKADLLSVGVRFNF